MVKERPTKSSVGRAASVDVDAVLAAASELLMTAGPSRVQISDVARMAGISRASVYRRWANSEMLVNDVLSREWLKLAAEVPANPKVDLGEQLVGDVVHISRAMLEHPLWRRIVDVDPVFFQRYLLEPDNVGSELQRQMVYFHLRRAMIEGSVRQADPEVLAASIVAIAGTFVLQAAFAGDVPDDFVERLTDTLRRHIAP